MFDLNFRIKKAKEFPHVTDGKTERLFKNWALEKQCKIVDQATGILFAHKSGEHFATYVDGRVWSMEKFTK